MKFLLAPVGTRGDVQPMVALAQSLLARGHDVTVCAATNFRDFVEGYGARFAPGGRDVQAVVREAGESLAQLRVMLPTTRALVSEQFELVAAAAREQRPDVIVATPLCVAAPFVAEALGARLHWAAFFPSSFPSADLPPPVVRRAPAAFNAPLWWLYEAVLGRALRDIVSAGTRRLGLARRARSMFRESALHHAFCAFDDVVGTAPRGWGSPHTVTGPWFLDDASPLPDEVESFLSAGPAPVFLGFGSMPHDDATGRARAIDGALAAAGCRAIVGRGWQGLGAGASDRVLVVDAVNHARLFPRCAAVVHHGGAGTVAQACRAGRPQVVVPHMFDQHYWAARLNARGVAPAPLRAAFTAGELGAALRWALSGDARARAEEVRARVAGYGGVALAAEMLERG